MSSISKLWHQALVFLEREHGAFVRLRDALVEQADALKRVDVVLLEQRQQRLELAIAETENTVYKRVKWQREVLPNLTDFTWSAFWENAPDGIDGILDLAKESDHPRAYEVAGNMIKSVADVTEKLAQLQEKMKKLKEVPGKAPKNVTNALFVGSTAELQKMLKKKKDE